MSERYGFSLTTFSPSGKLVQIEYALNAVNAGSPAVGIKAVNGVVLATEKKSKSLLHDDRTIHKVETICKNVGLVYSGMGPDYRLLVQKARKLAQEYMLIYEQNVPPTQLVKRVADVMQEYTQSGGVRPFGVSLLICGYDYDEDRPYLYQCDPSGSFFPWKATAIGRNYVNGKTFLEKRYSDQLALEDAVHTAILTLKESFEGQMTEDNIEIGICDKDGFRRLTPSEFIQLLRVHSTHILEPRLISINIIGKDTMSVKSPRYSLYREFVDAYMKGHSEMTRCTSHHNAQTEWNQIKQDEDLVKQKIIDYMEVWNKAGQPEREPSSKKSTGKNNGTPKRNSRKRDFSSEDDDEQNKDPNYDPEVVECVTPTFSRRKGSMESINIENEVVEKEKSGMILSAKKSAKKKSQGKAKAEVEKVKAPVQETVLNDLNEISVRIANLMQVKSMGLLTAENQKQLKKLIEQKQKRTADLKRLQAKQRASTRYRERKKRRVEQLCAAVPEVAVELSKAFRPKPTRLQVDIDCPDLLQIIAEIACIGGATSDSKNTTRLTLDALQDAIKERGYEIRKSSLYYRLLPQRAISHDGKKHVTTVPTRLRRIGAIESTIRHEDYHFVNASLKHIKDLAGIFGNDCVFYLTQNTKAKVRIGRPLSKGISPLLMRLDYEISSIESNIHSTVSHQFSPCIYAASIIDEAGLITNAGPTYVSLRSAKHDRIAHESHTIDFDRLVQLKEFERVARDHLGRVKPIIILSMDSAESQNNTSYPKTLASAIDKFRKYNLDVLIIVNQAPGQSTFNVAERRLAPLAQDLAGLILPDDYFGTHLNDDGQTEHVELEKNNFKLTGDVLSEIWSMNMLDEQSVIAEYINPSPMIDEQLQMADSTLALDSVIDQVCARHSEGESLELQSQQIRPNMHISSTVIKTECDIDELWCATHVIQTEYTIQIIRCNNTSCCTSWRSNYIQVFPHRFLPPPVPFHRSSRGVSMMDTELSSGTKTPISPFYGNLFQRIQFHGIVINRTQNELLPYDACCPSLQAKLSSRICSLCKQYIPTSIRLFNHYDIHRQFSFEASEEYNNKQESIIEGDALNDPYDIATRSIDFTKHGVYLFSDMVEWLKSDFEDDPIVDTKVKSTAATASAMIRKEKQMTTELVENVVVVQQEQTTVSQTCPEDAPITTNETLTATFLNQTQADNGSVLDALEQLQVFDDGTTSIGNSPSQQSWDDLEDLIGTI